MHENYIENNENAKPTNDDNNDQTHLTIFSERKGDNDNDNDDDHDHDDDKSTPGCARRSSRSAKINPRSR